MVLGVWGFLPLSCETPRGVPGTGKSWGSPLWSETAPAGAHCVSVLATNCMCTRVGLCPRTGRSRSTRPSLPKCAAACGNSPGQCKYAEHVPGCTPTRCARHGAASARAFSFTPWHQSGRLEGNAPAPTLPPSKHAPPFPFSPPALTFLRCFSWSLQPLFRPDRDSPLPQPPPLAHSALLSTHRRPFSFQQNESGGPCTLEKRH